MSESEIKNELDMTPKNTRSQSISKDIEMSKMRLNSNNLFAFQEGFDTFVLDDDHSNDTFYIPHNDSNFFSQYNDKSLFKLNDTTTEKQTEDDNRSYFTVDLELEKQVNLLTDCDDDLNDAKLSLLNNDISLLNSSQSQSCTIHNKTTPISKNNTQRGMFSQQSFSSLFEKLPTENTINANYGGNINPLNLKMNHTNNFNNGINTTTTTPYKGRNINHTINAMNKTMSKTTTNFHSVDLNLTNYMANYKGRQYARCSNPYSYYSFCKYNLSNNTGVNASTSNISHSSMPFRMFYKNDEVNKSFGNKMIAMIKDQNGSKLIQKKIEEKNPEFLNKLYDNICNNLFEVITDQYGNYVIQKYVEYCDKNIISKMLKGLQNKLYDISINNYGTRALQKMLENMISSDDDVITILNFAQGNVLKLIRDINGNHVIQSVIEGVSDKTKLGVIYAELNDCIIEVAKIKQGGCVFPKVLSNSTNSDRDMIVTSVMKNIDTLINDEYGNFIIQRVIKLNIEAYNENAFNYMKEKICKLSSQKYSSNVVECCLSENISIRDKVIEKILEKNNVSILIADQFGNYIIQKMLSFVKGDKFTFMIEQIKKAVKTLNQTGYGRKIYENLLKKYREFFSENQNGNVGNVQNFNKKKYKKK